MNIATLQRVNKIKQLTKACNDQSPRMNGTHLEMIGDISHHEYANHLSGKPTHPDNIDPRLNPGQLKYISDDITHIVPNQTPIILLEFN